MNSRDHLTSDRRVNVELLIEFRSIHGQSLVRSLSQIADE